MEHQFLLVNLDEERGKVWEEGLAVYGNVHKANNEKDLSRLMKQKSPVIAVAKLENFEKYEMLKKLIKGKTKIVLADSMDCPIELMKTLEVGIFDWVPKLIDTNQAKLRAGWYLQRIFSRANCEDYLTQLIGPNEIDLTKKENSILSLLFEKVEIERSELFKTIWGDTKIHPKTMDVHFCHLRRKLRAYGFTISVPKGGVIRLQKIRKDAR